jgi:hypothetical protein
MKECYAKYLWQGTGQTIKYLTKTSIIMGWFKKDSNGYKRSTSDGELIHRKVAAKKLGRSIGKKEVVHHLNRNKEDNRPGNLYVFKNQKAHHKTHKKDDWW